MARIILYGICVSPGIAIGRVRLDSAAHGIEERFVFFGEEDKEIEKLINAITSVKNDLIKARDAVSTELAEYRDVINSHTLICQDPKLIDSAVNNIREHRMCASWALNEVVESICDTFKKMEDPYLRDRVQDIRYVGFRIQRRLNTGVDRIKKWDSPCILLAENIAPAEAMDYNVKNILAFVTLDGGVTSHTAILARSLQIPAIVGIAHILKIARDGELVIVDALKGSIYIDPDQEELKTYTKLRDDYAAWKLTVQKGSHLPAETTDGTRISIQANIKNADEVNLVLSSGGEGVGLYRTEFAYLKNSLPTEDFLYAEYSNVIRQLAPNRVTFRTLDVGADKMLFSQKSLKEPNPALGLKAIRFCLRHQDIFKVQLRALLRAGANGNIGLMFPMISGIQEIQEVRAIIAEVIQELIAENIACAINLPIGAMIEVPSAVLVADALAKECDFFSIGTNDLAHYLLAIDRSNKDVSYLHEPLHPAIMRSIKHVIDCAHREGISVSVCGEMGADLYCIPILIGMGIDAISAAPYSIPIIKNLIRNLNFEKCVELAHSVLMSNDIISANSFVIQNLAQELEHDFAFSTTMIRTGM